MGSGGSRSGEDYGYNKENIEEIGVEINRQAQVVAQNIVDTIKTEIVDKVATEWYSEVAVTFFENYKTQLKAQEQPLTDIFCAFNRKIRNAGVRWASATGGEPPIMHTIETVSLGLDISSIQDNDNGDRYIKDNIATNVQNYVDRAKAVIAEYVSYLASGTDTTLAFFGGEQSEIIREAAMDLGDKVNVILDDLQASLVEEITKYQTTYIDTASTNKSTFADSIATE